MSFGNRTESRAAAVVMAAGLVVALGSLGCVTAPRLSMQAERCRIEVRMDPAAHRLVGRTVLDLVRTDGDALPAGQKPVSLELLLHPDLKITQLQTSGARGKYRGTVKTDPSDEDAEFAPRKHVVLLDNAVDSLTLFVEYQGELFQDVSAGEVLGEIHNVTMRAHIGEEGIYLADGYWYPKPVADEGADPILGDYVLIADPVPGLELAASAQRDPVLSAQTGWLAWRTPYPVDGMVLVGGPHEIHQATHNHVAINLHLKPSQAAHVEGLIDAVRRNLDRYEPLIGPYPAEEFAIVDNFFSSGFAFPTFTLLSSDVINMGKRLQTRHGMLDHEILHCWWGNGVHVDPRDGNWCEALTSYATNYYGYVLDGDEENARRKRRNYAHFLGRLKPEDDKPLDTFDREDGCGRGVGYKKGAMVFHMLARKIGQENFWAAMRRMTEEYVGAYASWDDIRRVCEESAGLSLETFFRQWVRGNGAPGLSVESARYDSADQTLTLALSQGEPTFELEVPIHITHAGGSRDVVVPLGTAFEEITVPLEIAPISVELDPDYHVFRKVPLEDIIPTTAGTRYGSSFACVLRAGEVQESYTSLQSIFQRSFEENECITRTVGSIETGALAERCALILGDAVHDPYVAGFLSAIEFPVRFTEEGFEFDGVTYADTGHAVLCTAAHPGVAGGGVTVLYANSDGAIPAARTVPMYDRSLVIFKNRRPVLRRDFEHRRIVQVER